MRPITIAIDGPAASGKGTAARGVAEKLSYAYIDTGAMYRSVALAAQRAGLDLSDEATVGALARTLTIRFDWAPGGLRVSLNGEDVSTAIRAEAVGAGASAVATLPAVRAALLDQQRALGAEGGVVMDGRDIGTVVLPNAELKVFLDANLDERARRRHGELQRRGQRVSLDEVRADIAARDEQDRGRAAAPLCAAADAVVLDSTHLTPGEVVDTVLGLVRQRRSGD